MMPFISAKHAIMEFQGHGGVMHFGISEGKDPTCRDETTRPGTDIFWNRPLVMLQDLVTSHFGLER